MLNEFETQELLSEIKKNSPPGSELSYHVPGEKYRQVWALHDAGLIYARKVSRGIFSCFALDKKS